MCGGSRGGGEVTGAAAALGESRAGETPDLVLRFFVGDPVQWGGDDAGEPFRGRWQSDRSRRVPRGRQQSEMGERLEQHERGWLRV